MRMHYEVNKLTDSCKTPCPVNHPGVTGGKVMVGSVFCQECPFCKGHDSEAQTIECAHSHGMI